ncbi:hypothetical protein PoB_004672900 [Plakobranchus ocellatus]|uniref:Uncharacterized protein n=1 Tax=Plakobranchus ocellatus TaxID=259542 RepID=A0AAV4BJD3_9GAST|nr:hypothetical protein PoB_004672900 [Plakobranchus ocellatus]
MTASRGFTGITTLVVASVIATSPLFMKCKALPEVRFSNVTIRFNQGMLQSFYDCLCGDNVEKCVLHYQTAFVQNVTLILNYGDSPSIPPGSGQNDTRRSTNGKPSSNPTNLGQNDTRRSANGKSSSNLTNLGQNDTRRSTNGKPSSSPTNLGQDETPRSTNGKPSSNPNEVTFKCDLPPKFFSGTRRQSCILQQANEISVCGCPCCCPVYYINETHSTMCKNKSVNIEWNSCHVEYRGFKDTEAPLLVSCLQPTSPTSQTSVTTETTEIISTTEGNFVTIYENFTTTCENLTTTHENPATTYENLTTTYENPTTTYENLTTTYENPTTTYENPTTTYENLTTTYENLTTTYENPTTTYENPTTTYENLTTTYENLTKTYQNFTVTYQNSVVSNESTLTTDRNPTTADENFDMTITNNSTPYGNNVTYLGISEETIKFDSTLAMAVGVSGGILVILVVSAIIAFLYWRRKKGKTNNNRDVQPDPANHDQQKNDYWILELEYTDSSQNRISGSKYSPGSECYCRPYETNWENAGDSYKNSVYSEEASSVTEEKKAPFSNDFDKTDRPIFLESFDVAPSDKVVMERINSEDPAYLPCYEEIDPGVTDFTLYSLASEPAGQTCLDEKAFEANSGHLSRETMDEKSTKSGQNTKNYQKVFVTCNHDSQTLPEISEKAKKQNDQGEDDDNYAKIGQIGEMDSDDLSTYNCESQSFSSLMERQNSDQDEGGDKFAKMNDIKEAYKGDLTKKKPELETCSESKKDKNAGKDEERPADNTYTGLGQTEEINDSDLATYNQESLTFSRLMDGNGEEKGKDGNNSAEIIHIKEPQSSKLKDEKSEDKDTDDMNDNYTEIDQITDSQSSSKVEDERDKERDKDELNDNYGEIVQMKGPQSSFKLKDERSEARDANDQNDTYAEIDEVTETVDNGPARHDYEFQSLSNLIDKKTPENNTDGPAENTYARLGQTEEVDDSDLATYNHESETFSKLNDVDDEEKDEDNKDDQDSTLARTKKPPIYELAIYSQELNLSLI